MHCLTGAYILYCVPQMMFRSIIGQALYQFIVMMVLVFAADKFVPEESWDFLSQSQRDEYPDFCEFSGRLAMLR